MEPILRKEMFMAKAAGQNVNVPEPITREEMFLKHMADNSVSKYFGESTEVLFDQRVEMLSKELMIEGALPISDGDLVKVTWDGAEYECTAFTGSNNLVLFGNPAIMGGEDNGIPFMMVTGTFNGEGMFGIIAPYFVGQTVFVKVEGLVVKTIDPKFLPEMSSYCHVNIWYDENAGGYSSDKTYNDIRAAEAAKIPVIGTLTVPSGNVYTLVGCDPALPSAYLVAFNLYSMPNTLKVFYARITSDNMVYVKASNFSGTVTDV